MEKVKKTRGPRKQKTEISVDNYMDFSAKQLYAEIEKLRGGADAEKIAQLKKENKMLKQKLSRIAVIGNYKEN